jgi:hypothetical protein
MQNICGILTFDGQNHAFVNLIIMPPRFGLAPVAVS